MQKRLTSRRDFCAEYGIGFTTFHKLLNQGQLRAVKIGRRTFVEAGDAESFISTLPAIGGAKAA
jgi:hypothetical protein